MLDQGVDTGELRSALTSAEKDISKEMEGVDRSTKGGSEEYSKLESQLEEISAAKGELGEHYGEDSGGMLAELIDLLTRIFDGGNPIPTRIVW